MSITLNGEPRSVPAGSRLVDLLERAGVDVRRIAVERNRVTVPRVDIQDLVVADGDAFEVVQFVGGG